MYFFQTKKFKIGLTAAAGVAVVLLILFSQQIGQLLNLFGSKADISTRSLSFCGTWGGTHDHTTVVPPEEPHAGWLTLDLSGVVVTPIDNCPNDPNKTQPGICGCGTPDTDTDGDGTLDCNELDDPIITTDAAAEAAAAKAAADAAAAQAAAEAAAKAAADAVAKAAADAVAKAAADAARAGQTDARTLLEQFPTP
ncbi:MAG: hypothetical protein V1826_00640 [bacterium]